MATIKTPATKSVSLQAAYDAQLAALTEQEWDSMEAFVEAAEALRQEYIGKGYTPPELDLEVEGEEVDAVEDTEEDNSAQVDEPEEEDSDSDSQEDEDSADEDEDDDFDLDSEFEGVKPSTGFTDPIPGNHIFYVRPLMAKTVRRTDDGIIHIGRVVYEVLAAEDEAGMEAIGGLFIEDQKLGGSGMKEYTNYSIAKQIRDGKATFLSRLVAYKPDGEKPSEMLASLHEMYSPDSGRCARVKIQAKQSKDNGNGQTYVNIKSVKVLDADVSLSDLEGFDAENWEFFELGE